MELMKVRVAGRGLRDGRAGLRQLEIAARAGRPTGTPARYLRAARAGR